MHSTKICPALMPLKCCWRCSCSTNLKKLSAIAFAVCWLKTTSYVSFRRVSSCCFNCFVVHWLPAAAEAVFAVISAAFARFCDGNAKSMRCLTTMPSDAKARSLAVRSSTVPTSSQEERAPSSLRCCSLLLRSMMNCCSWMYVYGGGGCFGSLNVP